MPERRKAINGLINWSDGKLTEAICLPCEKFDIDAVIDEMVKVELRNHHVATIWLTHEQYNEMQKLNKLVATQYVEPGEITMFGATVKVQDTPGWCVGIIQEF